MITPRITRLVRVPDLQSMQAYIAQCLEPERARALAIVVPTRSAAETLRETLEHRLLADQPALVLPDLLTRDDLYGRLHARRPDLPPRLTEFDREVIFRRAALDAAELGTPAPFRLRAGLILEILAFYDELRRHNRTIPAFDRLLTGSLAPSADTDRGAERLLRLTRFLVAAFEIFEQRIASSSRIDEHGLRERLLNATDLGIGYRRVMVTVPDQAADPRGLWPVDYDLLARLPGLEHLDIVVSENLLAAGYHERVHDALPGIEEARFGSPASPPLLAVPEPTAGHDTTRWIVCRDREEELVDVVRSAKARGLSGSDRSAVVFQRPLPYLYLAREVFQDAEIAYQAFDDLPLAAEPFAAALDLIFSFVASEATRSTIVELLASPHWSFQVDGRPISSAHVAALDDQLKNLKYAGGWERLASLATEVANLETTARATSRRALAADAVRAAADAAEQLRPVIAAESASLQLSTLIDFIAAHERLPDDLSPSREAHSRARAAVLGILEALRDAHRTHDDGVVPAADLLTTIRRWIENQTFASRTGATGVLLLDAPAAAYADIDDVRLAGLVDADWPEQGRRSIFYPSQLLSQLGWAPETERLTAARARFQDLLRLARVRTTVSTFTLEDDAIVPGSSFLEEIERAGLPLQHLTPREDGRVLIHEALTEEPILASALRGVSSEWLALRTSRSAVSDPAYHGATGSRHAGVYSVSSLERYLECPFKYFAAHVLRLPEERADESGLTPQERGQFLHAVFETFFREWQATGRQTITTANLADAVLLFEQVAERQLNTLPDSDRALERTYLLGSAAAAGLAERAFAFEIEHGGEVIERLLEHELEGTFVFQGPCGDRSVRLRAKADRIDLMADGTLRIVDYKLGKAPKPSRALQLPVYGLCAVQALDGRHERSWTLGRAGYVAFREKNAFVDLGTSLKLDEAVRGGQERLLNAVDGIERGEFPPSPEEPFLCTRCAYASVCRKDYVGDD